MELVDKETLKLRLKKTSIPTILVEGKDDILIYRWIAEWAGFSAANILQCEGKDTLREIFRERHLFPSVKLYITDQDMLIFSGIPETYHGMCFTSGYSIENDLFADGIGFLESLLSTKDKERRDEILRSMITWFAFEVELFLAGKASNNQFSKITIQGEENKNMPKKHNQLSKEFLESRGYRPASKELIEQITQNYKLQLRGKFLFQIIFKILDESPDKSFHNENLWKICLAESKRNHDKGTTYLGKLRKQITDSLQS